MKEQKKRGDDRKLDKLEAKLGKDPLPTAEENLLSQLQQHLASAEQNTGLHIPPHTKETPQASEESEDDFVLDLPCSSLSLEQSISKVFEIIGSVKIPSIERQHLNSLHSHISQLLASDRPDLNKRAQKSARKALKRNAQTTVQKQPFDEDEDIELEVTPFDLAKTPGKQKGCSQVMTRSQNKRKKVKT